MQSIIDSRYLDILEKTHATHLRFNEVEKLLTYPEVSIDNIYYNRLILEKNSLSKINTLYLNLNTSIDLYIETHDETLLKEMNVYYLELKNLLDSNQIDETSSCELQFIFSEQLLISYIINLYEGVLKQKGYKYKITNISKVPSISIEEFGVYSKLKKENGIYNVISNGKKFNFRILVLPNYNIEKIDLSNKFIEINRFHSSGAGGQNINKVETAIRLTHIPTKISVVCQNERSQIQNKNKAFEMLEQKVFAYYKNICEQNYNKTKKEALTSMKVIRIYNLDKKEVIDNIKNVTYKISELSKEI